MRRNICRAFFCILFYVILILRINLSNRALARSAVLPLSLTRHLPPAGGSLSYQGSRREDREEDCGGLSHHTGHGHWRVRRKKEPLYCAALLCGQRGGRCGISGKSAGGKPHRPPQRLCLPPEGGQPGALLRRRRTGEDGGHPGTGSAAAQRPDRPHRGGDPVLWRGVAGHGRPGTGLHHGYGPGTGKCGGRHGAQRH